MPPVLAILTAVVGGVLLTIQVAANRRLGVALVNPLGGAITSFVVGLCALVLCLALYRVPLSGGGARAAPWWAWTGGLMGAFYVASTIVLLPRLGAAALIGLAIAGQLLSGLAFDHYGWMGVPVHAMGPQRLVGALLLAVGVGLILRY